MQFLAVQYQGKKLPEAWLTSVLAKLEGLKHKSFGLATVDKVESTTPKITVLREPTSIPAMDDLKTLLAAVESETSVVWFSGSDTPMLADDIQPIELVADKNDKCVVAGFAVGKFTEKTGSSHTPAFHTMVEKVRPKMLELYDLCEGDLDTFVEEIQGKLLTREMESYGSEVFITILAATEPAHAQGYMKGMPDAKEFEFGYMTDALDFGGPPAAAAPAKEEAPPAPASMMDKLKSAMGVKPKAEGATPVTPEPAKQVPQGDPKLPATQGDGEIEYFQCEAGLSNKQAKNVYKRECGFIPNVPGGQVNIARPRVPKKKARSLAAMAAVTHASTSTAAVSTAAPVKNAEPAQIPAKPTEKVTPDTPVPSETPATEIPEVQLKAIHNSFFKIPDVQKTFDTVNEEILPPAIIDEMADRPSANALIKLDGGLERWHNLRGKWFDVLAVMAPKLHSILLQEYRYMALSLLKVNAELREKIKRQDAQLASPTQHVAAPAAKPAEPAKPAAQPAAPPPPPAASKPVTASFGMPTRHRKTA